MSTASSKRRYNKPPLLIDAEVATDPSIVYLASYNRLHRRGAEGSYQHMLICLRSKSTLLPAYYRASGSPLIIRNFHSNWRCPVGLNRVQFKLLLRCPS